MMTVIGVVTFLFVMIGSLYLQGRIATSAKRDRQCISVTDPICIAEVRTVLEEAGINFSDMLWSPAQMAYNQIGAAQRTPGEIWIKKSDAERAKRVLEWRYQLETSKTEIVVQEKLSHK